MQSQYSCKSLGEVAVVHSGLAPVQLHVGMAQIVMLIHNLSAIPSWSPLLIFTFGFRMFQPRLPVNAFLVPCPIEHKSKLFCTLYCMCQIYMYGICMTFRSVMFHTLYCMCQIYGMESPTDNTWLQLSGACSHSPNENPLALYMPLQTCSSVLALNWQWTHEGWQRGLLCHSSHLEEGNWREQCERGKTDGE